MHIIVFFYDTGFSGSWNNVLFIIFLVKGAKESICFQKSVSLVFKYLWFQKRTEQFYFIYHLGN